MSRILRRARNKRLGDTYEPKVREATDGDWRACIAVPRHVGDKRAYALGTVPPEVQFLTAGQDSRASQFHYTVWGWGTVKTENGPSVVCSWVIDCGIIEREHTDTIEPEDLAELDDVLLNRSYEYADGSMSGSVVWSPEGREWEESKGHGWADGRDRDAEAMGY